MCQAVYDPMNVDNRNLGSLIQLAAAPHDETGFVNSLRGDQKRSFLFLSINAD